MRSSIWKFEIEISSEQQILMPVGAKLLTVQMQHERACIWALVSLAEPDRELRRIVIRSSGWEFEDNGGLKYLGTIQTEGGNLIWHVFDGGGA